MATSNLDNLAIEFVENSLGKKVTLHSKWCNWYAFSVSENTFVVVAWDIFSSSFKFEKPNANMQHNLEIVD